MKRYTSPSRERSTAKRSGEGENVSAVDTLTLPLLTQRGPPSPVRERVFTCNPVKKRHTQFVQIEQGKILGNTHLYPLRVYYEDTDAGGIVYHARYLHFAERARTEMLRCMGLPHSELTAAYGVVIVVRGLEAHYIKPARLDEALIVRTKLLELGAASIKMSQLIGFIEPEIVCARLVVRLAAVNMEGRPTRLPQMFMEKAKALLKQEEA